MLDGFLARWLVAAGPELAKPGEEPSPAELVKALQRRLKLLTTRKGKLDAEISGVREQLGQAEAALNRQRHAPSQSEAAEA